MRTPLSLLLVAILVTSAQSERTISRISTNSDSSKWALVIGNANYKENPPLLNPVNDASDVGEALRNLGFQVEKLTNGTQQQMEDAIRRLGKRVKEGDVALFYYSGHGVQVDGLNYLVPIEMKADSEDEIKYKAVPAEMVLDKFERVGSSLSIVVLDACRDNPFKKYRSLNAGLAQMNAPAGTLIAYSTAPGRVASDGNAIDRNSPYTKHLLKAIEDPGIEIGMTFRQVRVEVMKETDSRQVPWESSSLTGEFYFAGEGDAEFYNTRGRQRYEKGEYNKAVADYSRAIRLNPKFSSAYSNRALASHAMGDYDMAMADHDEAIRLDPNNAFAYDARGQTWVNKGVPEKARVDFSHSIRLDPDKAMVYNNRGVTWSGSDHDKAIADFNRAIQLDPNCVMAYANRGTIWRDRGDFDKAMADCSKAVGLGPRDPWAWRALALLLAIHPDSRSRDGRQAVEYATTACELTEWRESDCIATLAAAYAESRNFDEAVKRQTEALRLAPEEHKPQFRSMLDLFKAGRPLRILPEE